MALLISESSKLPGSCLNTSHIDRRLTLAVGGGADSRYFVVGRGRPAALVSDHDPGHVCRLRIQVVHGERHVPWQQLQQIPWPVHLGYLARGALLGGGGW